MYADNSRLRYAVIFCLVFTLVAGCKTTGSRALADEEKQPQHSKRKWGTIALLVIGAGAAAVGGIALIRHLRAKGVSKINQQGAKGGGDFDQMVDNEGLDFDQLVDKYIALTRKRMENPDDEKMAKELAEIDKHLGDMVAKAGDEGDKLEADFDKKFDVLLKDPQYREFAIKDNQDKLAKLEAGELDGELRETIIKEMPNPRDNYQSFDAFLEAETTKARKLEVDSEDDIDDFELIDTEVEEFRRLWDNYEQAIDDFVEEIKGELQFSARWELSKLHDIQ